MITEEERAQLKVLADAIRPHLDFVAEETYLGIDEKTGDFKIAFGLPEMGGKVIGLILRREILMTQEISILGLSFWGASAAKGINEERKRLNA